jgi:cysteinyl-tRNA synthetase
MAKSFMSLFVKEDENAPKTENVPATNTTVKSQAPTSLGTFTAPVSVSERNEFSEFLNKIYQQGNFPGPDYQEFTDALKEVENEPMDEKSKFSTIFVGFKVQGVTKARLLETGNKYVTMINDQVSGFNTEIDNLLNTEVAQKQNKSIEIVQENTEIENQMRLLTEKKNKNNELIQKINMEVSEQVSALNIKKSSFASAANDFIASIKANIEKIKQYLPEPKVKA